MSKKRILLTGATGGMGFASLQELLKDSDQQDLVILVRDSKKTTGCWLPMRRCPG